MDKVADYMKTPVFSIYSEATVQEAARLMSSHNVGSLIVKGFSEFVGVVTERDLTRRIIGEGLPVSTPVSVVMSDPIFFIDKEENIMQANEMMSELNVRHLSVADQGQIIGVVSIKDVLSHCLKTADA